MYTDLGKSIFVLAGIWAFVVVKNKKTKKKHDLFCRQDS
jgi:hypothetical protein